MIRFATQEDINKIKKLWDDSFDDPLCYVDFIYDRIAKIDDTLVVDANENELVCMLTMIPVDFTLREKTVKAVYIYGAATAKRYQRRGYMAKLLAFAEDYCKNKGFALSVLVPGEPYLFDYYKARGYSADFDLRTVDLQPEMLLDSSIKLDKKIKIDKPDYEAIQRVREQALRETPHIAWSVKELAGAMDDCRMYSESVARYDGKQGSAYAVFGMQRQNMFIKEAFGTTNDAAMLLVREIISDYNPKNALLQLPVNSELFRYESERVRYGMSKPLLGKSSIHDMGPYMNLMLD